MHTHKHTNHTHAHAHHAHILHTHTTHTLSLSLCLYLSLTHKHTHSHTTHTHTTHTDKMWKEGSDSVKDQWAPDVEASRGMGPDGRQGDGGHAKRTLFLTENMQFFILDPHAALDTEGDVFGGRE